MKRSPSTQRTWARIHTWLQANAPVVFASLRPGASEEAIRAAEAEMGVAFPDEVKEAYRIHDGQEFGHGLFNGRQWRGLAEVVDSWKWLQSQICTRDDGTLVEPEMAPGEETRSDFWHPAWIPFASNDNGDFLCFDFDPAPAGRVGQIIYWWHDMPSPRGVAAPGFTAFLQTLANELEAGEWTTHPDYDGLIRVDEIFENEE